MPASFEGDQRDESHGHRSFPASSGVQRSCEEARIDDS
jgi:hypothetical protein